MISLPPPTPAPRDLGGVSATLGGLLRAPRQVAAGCHDDQRVRTIAITSLVAIVVGAAVFGGVIGSFRGGVQVAYAGLKLPLVMLATLALSAPAFHGLAAGFGRPWPMRAVLALTLASAGRAALVLLALAPAVWLVFDLGAGYHEAALVAALAYGLAAAMGLSVLASGLGPGPGRTLTVVSFAVVFLAVGGQTSWIFRPYLVRPRTTSVPFVRAREGSFVDAVWMLTSSARGVYRTEVSRADGRGLAYDGSPSDERREAP